MLYLGKYIRAAIYSGEYFTRVTNDSKPTDQELQAYPEIVKAFNNRQDHMDSPNNIRGIVITTAGIYIVRYNGFIVRKQDNSYMNCGNLVYTSKQNNIALQDDIIQEFNRLDQQGRSNIQVNIGQDTFKQPVLNNLDFILADEIILPLGGGDPDRALQNLVATLQRNQFPRLKTIEIIKNLGTTVLRLNNQSGQDTKTDKFMQALNYELKEGHSIKDIVNSINNLIEKNKQGILCYDLEKINKYGPVKSLISQPGVYQFDKIQDQIKKDEKPAEKQDKATDKSDSINKNRPYLQALQKINGGQFDRQIDQAIQPMFEIYKYLFGTGFTGGQMENIGVLTNMGVVRAAQKKTTSGDMFIIDNSQSDDVLNYKVLRGVLSALGFDLRSSISDMRKEFNLAASSMEVLIQYIEMLTDEFSSSNTLVQPYALQLRLIRGYIYNTYNKLNSQDKSNIKIMDGQTSINSEEQYNKILKALLKEIYWGVVYDSLIKSNGQTVEKVAGQSGTSGADPISISKIISSIQTSIQKINRVLGVGISVSRKYGLAENGEKSRPVVLTTYKIVTPAGQTGGYTSETLFNDFKNKTTSPSVKMIAVKNNSGNFIKTRIDIEYQDISNNMMAATEILSQMLQRGQLPSWRSVLMGEGLDGNPLTYKDFMNPKDNTVPKRAYAIYAGSGQGKGILTNTLLVHALSSGAKLAYIDGKPDTGISIGSLAWKKHKEAFVFDGMYDNTGEYVRGRDLESFTNGLRQRNESLKDERLIPQDLRTVQIATGRTDKQQIIRMVHIIQYFKCIDIAADIINDRASNKNLNPDDIFVVVFDECRAMAVAEKAIRDKFKQALKVKGLNMTGGTVPVKTEKNKDKWDQTVDFIVNWFNWMDSIVDRFVSISTKSLRPSQTNLFFIFQGSNWIKDNSETTMSRILNQMSLGKIIGRQGIEGRAPDQFGNTGTEKQYAWATEIKKPLTWAIAGSNAGTCSDDNVKVFRPYSLYGNSSAQIDMMNQGVSVKELTGEENKDINKTVAYFMEEVEEAQHREGSERQIDVASTLNQAYILGSRTAQKAGFSDLKDYIYSLEFLTKSSDDLKAGMSNGDDEGDSLSDINNIEDESDINQDGINLNKNPDSSTSSNESDMYNMSPVYIDDSADVIPARTSMYQPQFISDQNKTVVSDTSDNTEVCTNDNAVPMSKDATFTELALNHYGNRVQQLNPFRPRGAFEMAFYNQQINKLILDEISNAAVGDRRVLNLSITSNEIKVNGKTLLIHRSLLDPDGIFDTTRAINAKKIIKRFKNLRTLELDDYCMTEFNDQLQFYGDNRIKYTFEKMKRLEKIINKTTGKVIIRSEGLKTVYKDNTDVSKAITARTDKGKIQEQNRQYITDGATGLANKMSESILGKSRTQAVISGVVMTVGFMLGGFVGLIALQGLNMMARRKAKGTYKTILS